MLGLARLNRIDVARYAVRSEACRGCIRLHKTLLKERSALFRLLNVLINPLFDGILERIVGPAAVGDAKEHARRVTTVDAAEGVSPAGGSLSRVQP
jgi:hypothetical protein